MIGYSCFHFNHLGPAYISCVVSINVMDVLYCYTAFEFFCLALWNYLSLLDCSWTVYLDFCQGISMKVMFLRALSTRSPTRWVLPLHLWDLGTGCRTRGCPEPRWVPNTACKRWTCWNAKREIHLLASSPQLSCLGCVKEKYSWLTLASEICNFTGIVQ